MNDFSEISRRLADLERKMNSMIRVGEVSAVDREKCRAKVSFYSRPTSANTAKATVSDWLPIMVKQSTLNRDFWMPSVDEQVTCVFLPGDLAIGFILGSFYSDTDPIPEGAEAEGMRVVELSDGARFEYSTAESLLRIVIGDLEFEMTTENIRIGGPGATQAFVRGNDLVQAIQAHTHPTGVGPSGPPANSSAFPGTLSEIITGR